MSIQNQTIEQLRLEGLKHEARHWLQIFDAPRIIKRAAELGLSRPEIAKLAGVSEATVGRKLSGMTDNVYAQGPSELVFRATVDETDRDDLVAKLMEMDYTFGVVTTRKRHYNQAGSWGGLENIFWRGFLTEEEFRKVRNAVTIGSAAVGYHRYLAEKRLARIDETRAIYIEHQSGTSAEQIAANFGLFLGRVNFMLEHVPEDILEQSPEELINRAFVDGTDQEELFGKLIAIEYTWGEDAPCPFDGHLDGTWDQVVSAFHGYALSSEMFRRVKEAVDPQKPYQGSFLDGVSRVSPRPHT